MKRLFMLLLMLLAITTAFTQNITRAEYFFDTDPGQGNGFAITNLSPADTVNFTANIPLNALSPGFHILLMRVRNANGTWSNSESRYFYILSNTTTNTANITAAEYFFDADPGAGHGTLTPVGTAGPTVNFTASIPASLSPGFHFLAIRTRDADGKWGFSETRNFYLASPPAADMPSITAAEYFYDHDPGVGNGTVLNITSPDNIITQTFMVPVPDTMSASNHFLTIRVKDQAGHWSLFEKDTVTVSGTTATITCPGNVTIDPFTNNCKAVVSNIDAVGLPEDDSSYTYTLTGATTGNGIGTASGQLFNPGVTTVKYALINSPTISCSFTVTVNSSVTPTATISIPYTTICEGTQATFVCTYTGGGFFNTSWQWKKNGINVGANSNIYRDSTLENSDTITVSMTSAISCANPQTVTSAPVVMTVHETVTPSVSINASATAICPGQSVTFTAIPTHGGTLPVYEWVKNGLVVGADSVYQTSTLANGDSVYVRMYNNSDCVTIYPVTSNVIHITTSQVATPSVTISTPQTTICSGTTAIFTANPVNGGANPSYQWKVNGNTVGGNSNTLEYATLNNGDIVSVIMTSSLGCASPQSAISTGIQMTVLQSTPAFVTISTPTTTICSGTAVTFTASPTGGSPTYQWKLNGNDIPGATGSTYQSSSLANGDKIKVVMTPSSPCAFPSPAVSNEITMTVNGGGPASVTISATDTAICSGQQVTFTAAVINGGTDNAYEWTLNGSVVGSDTSVYQTTSLVNGDVVRVTMQPYGSCAGNAAVYSNSITMTVNTAVTPSVHISASAIDICAGTPVMFTATPTNGGSNPHYQWKLNGNNVGGDSAVYHSSTLANTDTIRVVMTSSLSCAITPTAVSNYISMDVSLSVTPSVTIVATATTICQWTTTSFTATPTNGGANPTYQWKLNGNNTGINSALYENSDLVNGDVVSVVMTSSHYCANPKSDTSNTITMTVLQPITYYGDADGDGYGSTNSESGTVQACGPQEGFVTNNSDCDDSNANIHPGATEICGNGMDDNCNGLIDENCSDTTILPVMNLRMYPVKEGDGGQTILNAEVTLDIPAPLPVAVHYSTIDEDAIAGLDYVAASGWLYIPAGSSSATMQLRIIGDLLKERNERFILNYTQPSNVVIRGDAHSHVMIIDDDKGKMNSTITRKSPVEEELLKIPSVTRRNQVWMIPQIGMYENEVLIMNTQGQLVSRFVNYRNHTALGNVSAGLYFYRIRILDGNGQVKYYSGRLLITE
jgi:Putative metal-binding motif/Calx-beta domain